MKRTLSFFLSLALAVVLCTSLIGCSAAEDVDTEEITTEEPSEEFLTEEPVAPEVHAYGAAARQYLQDLTDIGGRWSGSAAETETRDYIVNAFADLGYSAMVQDFSATGDDGETVNSANIIAAKAGDSPQWIVVGAHYDSAEDGAGTDDNGSGVAVLLETAKLIENENTPYTVYFVAFGAEEDGLLGSYEFISEMDQSEIVNIVLFVNMDSISAGDFTYVYSPEDKSDARDWAMDWASANDYSLLTINNVNLTEDGSPTADYAAFDEAGVPWIYFESTNWTLGNEDGYTQVDPQYGDNGKIIHTQYDNLAYLDETFPGRVDKHLDLYTAILYALLTEYK